MILISEIVAKLCSYMSLVQTVEMLSFMKNMLHLWTKQFNIEQNWTMYASGMHYSRCQLQTKHNDSKTANTCPNHRK